MIDLAFADLGLHRITARVNRDNAASIKVLDRLGFRHEATLVESAWLKGEWATVQVHAVLDREWADRASR